MTSSVFTRILEAASYNDGVEKLIDESIINIDRNIESIKEYLEYLLSQVKHEDDLKGSYIMQCMRGLKSRLIRKPYFTCQLGLSPKTNETQQLRLKNYCYDYYDLKHEFNKFCNQNDSEIIIESIGTFVYDQEIKKIHTKYWKNRHDNKDLQRLNNMQLSDLAKLCTDEMLENFSWEEVSAKYLNGRLSAETCRKLWKYVLNPQLITHNDWTENECKILKELVDKYGSKGNWIKIANEMPIKRTPFLIYRKWLELNSSVETDELWSDKEDKMLSELVDDNKVFQINRRLVNWNKIANCMPNRSAKDCERRWGVLKTIIQSRPFTAEEDLNLLLLINKIGTENWENIVRNMRDSHSSEQCKERYCELVDELQPWTYSEDRKIWISMRPIYKRHWNDGEQIALMTENLNLFRQLLPVMPNRESVIIRYRFLKLTKWFRMWNSFFVNMCRRENISSVTDASMLLSSNFLESDRQVDNVLTKLRSIIIQTSFMEYLVKVLRKNGYTEPEQEAEKMIMNISLNNELLKHLCQTNKDQSLVEHFVFLKDLQEGCFVPRRFEKFERVGAVYKRPDRIGDDLRLVGHNVLKMESGEILKLSIRKQIKRILASENVDTVDRKCLEALISSEVMFELAFQFAVSTLETSHNFIINCNVELMNQILTRLLGLMVQYIHEKDAKQYASGSFQAKEDKRRHLSQLVICRDYMDKIYKTFKHSFYMRQIIPSYFPPKLDQELNRVSENDELLDYYNAKVISHLSRLLQTPDLDEECIEHTSLFKTHESSTSDYDEIVDSIRKNVELIAPNTTTVTLLRSLVLQVHKFLDKGEQDFVRLTKIKYKNPVETFNKLFDTNEVLNASNPLCDVRYELLRMRVFSMLAMPVIASEISIATCEETANKLHDSQNGTSFTDHVSRALSKPEVIDFSKNPRLNYKRKGQSIMEILDLDAFSFGDFHKHGKSGIGPVRAKKPRMNEEYESSDEDESEETEENTSQSDDNQMNENEDYLDSTDTPSDKKMDCNTNKIPQRLTRSQFNDWLDINLISNPKQRVLIPKFLMKLHTSQDVNNEGQKNSVTRFKFKFISQFNSDDDDAS